MLGAHPQSPPECSRVSWCSCVSRCSAPADSGRPRGANQNSVDGAASRNPPESKHFWLQLLSRWHRACRGLSPLFPVRGIDACRAACLAQPVIVMGVWIDRRVDVCPCSVRTHADIARCLPMAPTSSTHCSRRGSWRSAVHRMHSPSCAASRERLGERRTPGAARSISSAKLARSGGSAYTVVGAEWPPDSRPQECGRLGDGFGIEGPSYSRVKVVSHEHSGMGVSTEHANREEHFLERSCVMTSRETQNCARWLEWCKWRGAEPRCIF